MKAVKATCNQLETQYDTKYYDANYNVVGTSRCIQWGDKYETEYFDASYKLVGKSSCSRWGDKYETEYHSVNYKSVGKSSCTQWGDKYETKYYGANYKVEGTSSCTRWGDKYEINSTSTFRFESSAEETAYSSMPPKKNYTSSSRRSIVRKPLTKFNNASNDPLKPNSHKTDNRFFKKDWDGSTSRFYDPDLEIPLKKNLI